jgi:hypothetical protein
MPASIIAKVRGLGQHYADGLEMLSVDVKKPDAVGLSLKDGLRTPINLLLGADSYQAGLRTTARMPTVWISPDLIDGRGERTTLARLLTAHGFRKNQTVLLVLEEDGIRLMPAPGTI